MAMLHAGSDSNNMPMDFDCQELTQYVLQQVTPHLASQVALVDKLDVDKRHMEDKLCRLATCFIHSDRIVQDKFVNTIVAHSLE
eukprot:6194694-Pyramimonas_sp.AAC.1